MQAMSKLAYSHRLQGKKVACATIPNISHTLQFNLNIGCVQCKVAHIYNYGSQKSSVL